MEAFTRICVIGVGLIGGSFGLALKRAGCRGEIVGLGRDASRLDEARRLGAIDRAETDPARALAGCELALVAVPLGAFESVLRAITPHLPADCVITDAGSAKQCVIESARRVLGTLPARFVPGHPIAGAEQSGVAAARADLFSGRRVLLTPTAQTDVQALARARALWAMAGAEVLEMDAVEHDAVLAATSHLPHLLAYALVDCLTEQGARDEVLRYAAGGFRDFTRIAASDAVMWRDICLGNGPAILAALGDYQRTLDALSRAVASQDGTALFDVFTRARAARLRYAQQSGASANDPE